MNNKYIKIYMGVNKNGFVSLHLEEPKREDNKWKSNKPFCNSVIQGQLEDLVKRAQMTWESEPEYFEISYE